jgi:hypothetical protein
MTLRTDKSVGPPSTSLVSLAKVILGEIPSNVGVGWIMGAKNGVWEKIGSALEH